jgi:hypothetical protein
MADYLSGTVVNLYQTRRLYVPEDSRFSSHGSETGELFL